MTPIYKIYGDSWPPREVESEPEPLPKCRECGEPTEPERLKDGVCWVCEEDDR